MQYCALILALLLATSLSAYAQEENLVTNGYLQDAPSPQTPGTEHHAGADNIPIPAGSALIPGWTVDGKLFVSLWKSGKGISRSFNLSSGSHIWQVLPTQPSAKYLLHFSYSANAEGPSDQTFIVSVDGRRQAIDPKKFSAWNTYFDAGPAPTRLEFIGTAKGPGPFIYAISVQDLNPKKREQNAVMKALYAKLDAALREAADTSLAGAILSADFSATSKSGESLDRANWLSAFQKLSEKNPRVSSVIVHMQPNPQGEMVVTVERRVSSDGETQKIVTKSRLQEVWAPSGETWTLKSSKEE